jgi:ADP-ribose pyrophosphatase YjhB (NUDIX family)
VSTDDERRAAGGGRAGPVRASGGRPGGRDAAGSRAPRAAPAGRLGDTPAGAREPIGIERATRRGDAPVRRTDERAAPPRPALPEDERPALPRGVEREIERALGPGRKAKDVALALSIGAAAIDEDRADIALPMLAWAKHEAPRVSAVREAYGVALYLHEDYAGALSELHAYRRLTGRLDQNHLVADCYRALGRELDKVIEAAQALATAEDAPEDRRAEAVIVWAAALADAGDVGAGRAVVRRFLERPRAGDQPHDLRVRYLAADLAERQEDGPEAARQLELIAAVDPELLDVDERLRGYRGAGG